MADMAVKMTFSLDGNAASGLDAINKTFDLMNEKIAAVNVQLAGLNGAPIEALLKREADQAKKTAKELADLKKQSAELVDANEKLNLSLKSQLNAYSALKSAMTTDVELAKSSAVQRRIFNSLLTTGKEAVDANTLSMAKAVEGIKQEIDLSTKLLVLKDGLTASEMRQIEARRAKQMATKSYVATLANQQYGFKPGEAMATKGMFDAAHTEDVARTKKRLADEEISNIAAINRENKKLLADYTAAEEAKREAIRRTHGELTKTSTASAASLKQESAARLAGLSSLERAEAKVKELMEGRNKLSRSEAIETLKGMGWTKEYEALNAKIAASEQSRFIQKLQQTSAILSGKEAIRNASLAQEVIEKRDMELQKARWAAEKALVKTAHAPSEGLTSNSLAIREFLVMLRELSRGDMTRFAGSFSIFAQSIKIMPLLLHPVTLAVAAIGGTLASAFVLGKEETNKFNNAIIATGNYANMTREQANHLAESMSKTSSMTIGTSKEVINALIASGRYGEDTIKAFASVTDLYAKSTGVSAAEASNALMKAFKDPMKGAQELNAHMNFLNQTQMENIRLMQASGDKDGATALALELLGKHLEGTTNKFAEQGGYIERTTKALSNYYDKLKEHASSWGSAGTPKEDLQRKIDELEKEVNFFAKNPGSMGSATANSQQLIHAYKEQIKYLDELAQKKAQESKLNKEDEHATELTAGSKIKQIKALQAANEDLDKYISGKKGNAHTPEQIDEFNATKRENLDRIKQLRKPVKNLHVTAEKADDIEGIATSKASATWQKNELQQKNTALQKLRDDELITHAEYLKRRRVLQADESHLEIAALESEKKYVLDKAKRESIAKIASGDPAGAKNAIATGNARAIELSMQARILASNADAATKDTGGDVKADKEDRLKAAKEAINEIKLVEQNQLEAIAKRESDLKRAALLGQVRKRDELAMEKQIARDKDKIQLDALESQKALYAKEDDEYKKLLVDEMKMKAAQLKQINDLEAAALVEKQKQQRAALGDLENGFAKFFMQLEQREGSAKSNFKAMISSFLSSVQGMINQNISKALMQSIFGTGNGTTGTSGGNALVGLLGKAFGGFGSAPSTSASGLPSGWSANAGAGADMASSAAAMDTAGLGLMVPQFAVGTDFVPQDMLAVVHKGEKITPAAFNTKDAGAQYTNVNHFTLSEPTNTRTQTQIAAHVAAATRNASRRNG
jgi:phage-related minor tail protein